MDKLMQAFDSPEFGQVRTALIDGKPYAMGSDVARALGYAIPHKAVRDHCKGVLTWNILTPGGEQQVLMIPEGDIYRLIVKAADQGANPEIRERAERFERWIFDEVLPQIRKTGMYALVPKTLPEALRAYADEVERRQALEAKVEADRPKVEFAERVADADGLQDMGTVAKALGWGRNRLFAHLRKMRVLMNNNTPLQHYVESGYFVVREKLIRMGDAEVVKPQTYVTSKGLEFIHRVCKDALPAKGFPGHRPGGGKPLTVLQHEFGRRAEQLGGLR